MSFVTSKAQAEVAQIPFDGQPYFFFNTSTRELYGKAFDPQTGNCPLIDYVPAVQAAPPQYATVDMLTALEKRLEEIAGMIPAGSLQGILARQEGRLNTNDSDDATSCPEWASVLSSFSSRMRVTRRLPSWRRSRRARTGTS